MSIGAIINVASFSSKHTKTIFEKGLWGFPERDREKWSRLERGTRVLLYGDGGIRAAGYVKGRYESREPVEEWVKNPTGYPLRITLDLINVDVSRVKPVDRGKLVDKYGIRLAKMGFRGWNLVLFGPEGTYPIERFNGVWDEFLKSNNLQEVVISQSPLKPEGAKPSHWELVEVVCKLGELFNFHVKKEEWTPDRAYRCDVTWREYETHLSPIKVFEVELSGNVDHALSSLSHAYDTWRPEQLYLIVEDERDGERAKMLVEPRVKGAFARIANKLRVVGWSDVYEVYECLKHKEDLVKNLTKR